MVKRRTALMVALILIFFAVPFVPWHGQQVQFAGFFPRYASPSCVLFHVGVAIGPDSFQRMAWVVSPFCSVSVL